MAFALLATTQTLQAQDEKQSISAENFKDLASDLQTELNFNENQIAVIQRALTAFQKAEIELNMNKANMNATEIKDFQKRYRRNFESVLSEVLTEDEYIQFKKWYKTRNKR